MHILDKMTRDSGTVNEKLAARKFAIDYLIERGERFVGSPTGIEICDRLGIRAHSKKQASSLLLVWASSRRL